MARQLKNIYVLLALALSAIFSSSASYAECSKTLTFANTDWLPNIDGSKQITRYRRDFVLLNRILATANCTFRYKSVPYNRLHNDIRTGAIDGTTSASYTAARSEYAWFSDPYRQEIMALFMRPSDIPGFNPATLDDIARSDLRIGLNFGSWHGTGFETLKANYPDFQKRLLPADNFDIKFQWLVRGRVDAVISDRDLGEFVINRNNLQGQIAAHPFVINDEVVHFMLSKKTVPIGDVKVINLAIQKFTKTAEYSAIIDSFDRSSPAKETQGQ